MHKNEPAFRKDIVWLANPFFVSANSTDIESEEHGSPARA